MNPILIPHSVLLRMPFRSVAMLLAALSLLGFPLSAVASVPAVENMRYSVEGEPEAVVLGELIAEAKQAAEGKKKILKPKNIQFLAKLKAMPEQKQASYLYKALDLMKVLPYPRIQHQMFIEADNAEVIAVYVDIRIVEAIRIALHTEQEVLWFGYHIYNYSRGPAIVIENFEIKE